MSSNEIYSTCLPILQDTEIEQDEKTDKVQELVRRKLSLGGKPLENAVLSILWRFREAEDSSAITKPGHHTVKSQTSPAPWQISRTSTPNVSPALRGASPAPLSVFGAVPPSLLQSRSCGGGSSFSSPRPSPRIAFANPVPHSPNLSSYEFSEPSLKKNNYGDYGSDVVEWLTNEDSDDGPTSSVAGSAPESTLNATASSWSPLANEMTPHDKLRSIMGDGKTNEEIDISLEANGYDLSTALMGRHDRSQQQQGSLPKQNPHVLVGRSMASSQPLIIDPAETGHSNVICKFWLSHGSCLRADCRFSHDLSSHICKYWIMGTCLAGDSCIFSHDPALLMSRVNIDGATGDTSPRQVPQSPQVQDFNTFPALQTAESNRVEGSRTVSPRSIGPVSSRRHCEPKASPRNSLPSSYGSPISRPISRDELQEPTPITSIPVVSDTNDFPSLGTVSGKGTKKHHGKRGGHSHGHNNKENTPSLLADVVRMPPTRQADSPQKGLSNISSYTVIRENSLAVQRIAAPQHVPWLETGSKANQHYLSARQKAFQHGGLRNKFLQSAAQAWNRNDARAAKALSLRGQSENDLMRKAHREAAQLLYEERNRDSSVSQEIYVDLHGLHPEEATEYLEQALIEHERSSLPVYAITGTGHHSKNGKDKVGKAIRGFLNEWRYAFREFSVAGDNLGGILGIDPGSYDRTLGEKQQAEGER